LKGTEAHVWAAALDISSELLCAYAKTLSGNERERARRFHFERDQKHFIAGRGTLRAILGSYLKMQPAGLQFEYGPRGKPMVAKIEDNPTLHFNLAHSDGLLVVAVTEHCSIGVDVERVRLMEQADDLVERFFSPNEAKKLRGLPVHQRTRAFFNLWTRKEACLKATGDGIAERLHEIAVSFLPDEPVRVLNAFSDTEPATAVWTLAELSPAEEYAAAIAAAAPRLDLSCWRWSQ
jgi:4'-phosphopantetheinyl transferase